MRRDGPPAPLRFGAAALYALIGGITAAVLVRFGTYAAAISDSSAYVAQGMQWRDGVLLRPGPLQLLGEWARATDLVLPLGFRVGTATGTEVGTYPLGMPLLVAAALRLAGELGPYLVPPLAAGALVIASAVIAHRLSGPLAGVLAAGLVATDPIVLMHGVSLMSDVPAAACWLGAVALLLRRDHSAALASGFVTALAIMIRPNLAPLAAAPVLLAWQHGGRVPAAIVSLGASLGIAVTAWTQSALYGGALNPGYPGWEGFFAASHLRSNVVNDAVMFTETNTWIPVLGLAVPLVYAWRRSRDAATLALLLSALALANVSLYLFYLPYDSWPFLRFLLVGTSALFILFACGVAEGMRLAGQRPRLLLVCAIVAAMLVAPVMVRRVERATFALGTWRAAGVVPLMSAYLKEVLPRRAVAFSFYHSGTLALSTGCAVVRLDLIDPQRLDAIVERLTSQGQEPVFVIDETLEEPTYRERFARSRYGKLDWPPRAEFVSQSRVRYFAAADVERASRHEPWPVDIVR